MNFSRKAFYNEYSLSYILYLATKNGVSIRMNKETGKLQPNVIRAIIQEVKHRIQQPEFTKIVFKNPVQARKQWSNFLGRDLIKSLPVIMETRGDLLPYFTASEESWNLFMLQGSNRNPIFARLEGVVQTVYRSHGTPSGLIYGYLNFLKTENVVNLYFLQLIIQTKDDHPILSDAELLEIMESLKQNLDLDNWMKTRDHRELMGSFKALALMKTQEILAPKIQTVKKHIKSFVDVIMKEIKEAGTSLTDHEISEIKRIIQSKLNPERVLHLTTSGLYTFLKDSITQVAKKIMRARVTQLVTRGKEKTLFQGKKIHLTNSKYNGTTHRTIVITVPHGACAVVHQWNHGERHLCDSAAERAARCIVDFINKNKAGVRAILYLNKNLPRYRCDLNRSRCRNTAFRRGLRKLVRNNSSIDFVLDLHSFPGNENAWNLGGDRDPELLILDDDYGRHQQTEDLPNYVINLLETMRSKGIHTSILPGIMNDIQRTMRHQEGIKSVLLEVQEKLSTERLENLICPAVAKWLINSKF